MSPPPSLVGISRKLAKMRRGEKGPQEDEPNTKCPGCGNTPCSWKTLSKEANESLSDLQAVFLTLSRKDRSQYEHELQQAEEKVRHAQYEHTRCRISKCAAGQLVHVDQQVCTDFTSIPAGEVCTEFVSAHVKMKQCCAVQGKRSVLPYNILLDWTTHMQVHNQHGVPHSQLYSQLVCFP